MIDTKKLEELKKLIEGMDGSVLGKSTILYDGTKWIILSRLGTSQYYMAIRDREGEISAPVHVIEVAEGSLR